MSTATNSGTTASSGGMNKAIMVLALLGVAYISYRFVIKPMLDKRKEEVK
jgi:peptidoglycan/LPS O-acetylase OafA/YrhL